VNLALPPPGIKFKASSMPFTQRENISQFLQACEMPPLNMPAHDRFLTVDLYDSKDPAQVIQCLGAFSRAANGINPTRFPRVIGPRRPTSPSKRTSNGGILGDSTGAYNRARKISNASQGSDVRLAAGRPMSPALTGGSSSSRATDGGMKSPSGHVSSWSKKSDEGTTAPAWNIHQYGYMGGASQGNQGISFGARRQITSPVPGVPSFAEKERARKDAEAEIEKQRLQAVDADRRRQRDRRAEEERERCAEEARWEQETRKARDKERQKVEERKRQWEEQEKRWKEEEELRLREEQIIDTTPGHWPESNSDLRGQYLSQYQAEPKGSPSGQEVPRQVSDSNRIRELERQLEEAMERERQYQLERDEKARQAKLQHASAAPPTFRPPKSISRDEDASVGANEREYLQMAWTEQQNLPALPTTPRPLPNPEAAHSRPLPQPELSHIPFEPPPTEQNPPPPPPKSPRPLPLTSPDTPPPRPLPNPATYNATPSPASRTDRYLSSNPAPSPFQPRTHTPSEMGMTSTSERAAEDARRMESQKKTKAGGWASKSLLEREMERERERQREWEEAQVGRANGGGAVAGAGAGGAARGLVGPRELRR